MTKTLYCASMFVFYFKLLNISAAYKYFTKNISYVSQILNKIFNVYLDG